MIEIVKDSDYKSWLIELKSKIKQSQIKAALSVNSEVIKLYWYIGKKIWEIQRSSNYGDGIITQVATDLKKEFPNMAGFSRSNIFSMRQFFLFYQPDISIVQQAVGLSDKSAFVQQVAGLSDEFNSEFFAKNDDTVNAKQIVSQFTANELFNLIVSIPWGHHTTILRKIKDNNVAQFYLSKIVENNWSRSVLEYQIETDLFKRQGKAITNFKYTLPAVESDLADALLKDPYNFEFITLTERAKEKDLEIKLIQHISQFLLELGKGFAYMGRQFLLKIGNKEYRTDLLFYHTKLKSYIVIELKLKEFEPEFIGKLNFYISAINELIRANDDNPTIGILLCKRKDNYEVEFSLKDINKPIGVSEFVYKELLNEINEVIPELEQFENELRKLNNE